MFDWVAEPIKEFPVNPALLTFGPLKVGVPLLLSQKAYKIPGESVSIELLTTAFNPVPVPVETVVFDVSSTCVRVPLPL